MKKLMKKLLYLTLATAFVSLSSPSTVWAQEFGILGGFGQTTAESKVTGVSTEGEIGFRVGGVAKFEMTSEMFFRSGLIYSYRPFGVKSGATEGSAKFAYLDVPALLEYKMNDTFGFFGGLVIGINTSDKAEWNGQDIDPQGMKSMYPLAQVGVNLLFQDMFGFDIYYERGLGEIHDGAENYSTFGANFVYWLY